MSNQINLDELRAKLGAMKMEMVASQDHPDKLQDYADGFNGGEKAVATVCVWMGWNTAINAILDALDNTDE